jgi:hypothetical protein
MPDKLQTGQNKSVRRTVRLKQQDFEEDSKSKRARI